MTEKDLSGEIWTIFPDPRIVTDQILEKHLSLSSRLIFPIQHTLKIKDKRNSLGSVFVSFYQDSPLGDVKIWTSVESRWVPSEGLDHYLLRGKDSRALVCRRLCKDISHFMGWFERAVMRVYVFRVSALFCYIEHLDLLHGWCQEMLDVLFEDDFS